MNRGTKKNYAKPSRGSRQNQKSIPSQSKGNKIGESRSQNSSKCKIKLDSSNVENEIDSRELTESFSNKLESDLVSDEEKSLERETNVDQTKIGDNENDTNSDEDHTISTDPCLRGMSHEVKENYESTKSVQTNLLVSIYQDDEEIDTAKTSPVVVSNNEDEDENEDFDELTAALTVDDNSESTFVVYPLGSCELDEIDLVSTASTKVIQKCILRLSTKPMPHETNCWGLDQSSPVGMTLFDDYIQFTDLKSSVLLRSQPIHTFKAWAVDDDNKFAFVIEDRPLDTLCKNRTTDSDEGENLCGPLASEPVIMCYVFHSIDDDDMNCKVASKLSEAINRYRQFMNERQERSVRIQQMVSNEIDVDANSVTLKGTVEDGEDDFDASNDELTMNVKYIGQSLVPRPTGIDMLNAVIDKCLATAITNSNRLDENVDDLSEPDVIVTTDSSDSIREHKSPLINAKLHISPSSVIVENEQTGEIIVECRIRFLTFIGISKRDLRWCGFIMQTSSKSKTFIAHTFECHPTAGPVCEAIQQSCVRMYEKVIKNSRERRRPEAMTITPTKTSLRNTLAKTFSRIKLTSSMRY